MSAEGDGLSAVSFVAIAFSHNIIWIGAWLFLTAFVEKVAPCQVGVLHSPAYGALG